MPAQPSARAPETPPAAVTRGQQPRVLPVSGDAPEELPRVLNELAVDEPDNRRRETDQLDLFGAGHAPREGGARPATAATVEAPATSDADAGDDAPAAGDDGVISLYIRAHEGQQFGGPELVRAFNAAGMRHGCNNQARLAQMASPCSAPQAINVQPAPCHRPHSSIVPMTAKQVAARPPRLPPSGM